MKKKTYLLRTLNVRNAKLRPCGDGFKKAFSELLSIFLNSKITNIFASQLRTFSIQNHHIFFASQLRTFQCIFLSPQRIMVGNSWLH